VRCDYATGYEELRISVAGWSLFNFSYWSVT